MEIIKNRKIALKNSTLWFIPLVVQNFDTQCTSYFSYLLFPHSWLNWEPFLSAILQAVLMLLFVLRGARSDSCRITPI